MQEKKGNKISNWNLSYEYLPTTYSVELDTPSNMVNVIQYEFVLEDIRRYLGPKESLRILEVGCGGARTSVYLARRGYNTSCTDNSPEAIRLAKANFDSAGVSGNVIQDDLFNSRLEKGVYDCVMSFGLLEHFEDLRSLVSAIDSFLRPGGIHIHCVIPKKFSTEMIMNALMFPLRFAKNVVLGRFDRIIVRSFRDFPHYENSFGAVEYCEAFEHSGDSILRCEASGVLFPLFNLPLGIGNAIVRTFGRPLYWLIKTINRSESRILHLFSPAFYIVARKGCGSSGVH